MCIGSYLVSPFKNILLAIFSLSSAHQLVSLYWVIASDHKHGVTDPHLTKQLSFRCTSLYSYATAPCPHSTIPPNFSKEWLVIPTSNFSSHFLPNLLQSGSLHSKSTLSMSSMTYALPNLWILSSSLAQTICTLPFWNLFFPYLGASKLSFFSSIPSDLFANCHLSYFLTPSFIANV